MAVAENSDTDIKMTEPPLRVVKIFKEREGG